MFFDAPIYKQKTTAQQWYILKIILLICVSTIHMFYGVMPRRGGYGPLLWQHPQPGGPRSHSETNQSRKNYRRERVGPQQKKISSELLTRKSADASHRQ